MPLTNVTKSSVLDVTLIVILKIIRYSCLKMLNEWQLGIRDANPTDLKG